MPNTGPEAFWAKDLILIEAGYSKEDFENMEIEEYDWIFKAVIGRKNKTSIPGGV